MQMRQDQASFHPHAIKRGNHVKVRIYLTHHALIVTLV